MLLLANIKKELLLLSRDRAGLLVLFVMPMLLVLVLSLVQDDLFRASGQAATRAVFVNLDQGSAGVDFAAQLEATGALELVREDSCQKISADRARQLVLSGDYQFALVVPKDFSHALETSAESTVRAALREQS